jgi:hypothetical protein
MHITRRVYSPVFVGHPEELNARCTAGVTGFGQHAGLYPLESFEIVQNLSREVDPAKTRRQRLGVKQFRHDTLLGVVERGNSLSICEFIH